MADRPPNLAGKVRRSTPWQCRRYNRRNQAQKRGEDFVIELKANQRALQYGIEDKIKSDILVQTFSIGSVLEHGGINTWTCLTYDRLEFIADKEK